MLVTKCDICKKEIKNRDEEIAVRHQWHGFSFCGRGGRPIAQFLKRQKLLKESAPTA